MSIWEIDHICPHCNGILQAHGVYKGVVYNVVPVRGGYEVTTYIQNELLIVESDYLGEAVSVILKEIEKRVVIDA